MSAAPIHRMRVLIVEDNGFTRKLLKNILRQINVTEVTTSSNGEEARIAVSREHFDIILLDWEMPVVSGKEFMAWLRCQNEPSIANLPVIVLTSHSQKAVVAAAARLGANDFLVKPVSAKLLEKRLLNCLEGGSSMAPPTPPADDETPPPPPTAGELQELASEQATSTPPPKNRPANNAVDDFLENIGAKTQNCPDLSAKTAVDWFFVFFSNETACPLM